jgi:DNA (cytosine-5)-methyltransferase 1
MDACSSALKQGQDGRHCPEELRAGGHETKYRRHAPMLRRPLLWRTRERIFRILIHPKLQRGLTAREAARIQSFSNSYEFRRSQESQLSQVGNAVPVQLGRALGAQLHRILTARRRATS